MFTVSGAEGGVKGPGGAGEGLGGGLWSRLEGAAVPAVRICHSQEQRTERKLMGKHFNPNGSSGLVVQQVGLWLAPL